MVAENSASVTYFQLLPIGASGLFSSVCDMKSRSAAHLFDGSPAWEVVVASWAMFFVNRSRSPLSNFSLLFNAPGRLFKLFLLMMLTWFRASVPVPRATSSSLGSALARESSVVTSLLLGLLRRGLVDVDFVTFDMRRACFIALLSFFEAGNSESPGWLVVPDFLRMDFEGLADDSGSLRSGACLLGQKRISGEVFIIPTYHN